MDKLIFNFSNKNLKNISNPKEILGGKGANLAYMAKLGLPVPPGFTISTKVCDYFYKNNKKIPKIITKQIMKEIKNAIPNTAGLKHSGPAFTDLKGFVDLNISCFIGNANLMPPALTLGASGCIDGPLNAAPELWSDIWKTFKNNENRKKT